MIPNLGRNPDLHPFGKELVVFSQGGRRLHRTGDGRTWIERQPTRDLDTGAGIQLAQGQGRFVHADFNGIRYSADGVVWQEMREPIVPSMKIEIRNPDGTYRQVPRDVQWCHAQYADPFFVLVGGTWEPNRRYESGSPDPDQTVVAFSADGIHWKSARVAVAPAREWRGVGAQGQGKVLLTHARGSREALELDLMQEISAAVLGRHPIGYGYLQAGLHREIDEALARRDGRTAVRALVELEKFYPSEAALRYSAIVRAQLGDLDGAWTALATLETLAPDDVELAVLRGTVLQGSGRVAEAQAYARWFLAQKQAPWPQEPALALKAKLARFQLMLGSGDVAQATGFAENEVQRDKTNVEFRIMLAMIALQKGDAATARRWLTEAAAQGDARAQQMLSRLPP